METVLYFQSCCVNYISGIVNVHVAKRSLSQVTCSLKYCTVQGKQQEEGNRGWINGERTCDYFNGMHLGLIIVGYGRQGDGAQSCAEQVGLLKEVTEVAPGSCSGRQGQAQGAGRVDDRPKIMRRD